MVQNKNQLREESIEFAIAVSEKEADRGTICVLKKQLRNDSPQADSIHYYSKNKFRKT